MKKKYLIVIVFAISQIALAGNRIPKQNWQIHTKDTRLTVGISNNRPVIYELKKCGDQNSCPRGLKSGILRAITPLKLCGLTNIESVDIRRLDIGSGTERIIFQVLKSQCN